MGMSMAGASKLMWPLVLLAALPLLLSGCGSNSDPNAATQFRPVDDDAPPAKAGGDAKPLQPDETAPEPPRGSAAPTKKPGAPKSTPNSVAKGASGRAPSTKEAAPSDDPAL